MSDEKKVLSDEQLTDVNGGRNLIPPLIMNADPASTASTDTAASAASTLADEPAACIR